MLDYFYIVSGLRLKLNKCEIASIGANAKVALCGLKTLDLNLISISMSISISPLCSLHLNNKIFFSFHYYVHYAVIKTKSYFSRQYQK